MRVLTTGQPPQKIMARDSFNWHHPYAKLARDWIKAQIEILLMKHPRIEFCTGLALGPEMWAGAIYRDFKIPYTVIALCYKQDFLWDPKSKKIYRGLLEGASEVIYATEGRYFPRRDGKPGAEAIREIRMLDWLKEDDENLMLFVGNRGMKPNLWRAKERGIKTKALLLRRSRGLTRCFFPEGYKQWNET